VIRVMRLLQLSRSAADSIEIQHLESLKTCPVGGDRGIIPPAAGDIFQLSSLSPFLA